MKNSKLVLGGLAVALGAVVVIGGRISGRATGGVEDPGCGGETAGQSGQASGGQAPKPGTDPAPADEVVEERAGAIYDVVDLAGGLKLTRRGTDKVNEYKIKKQKTGDRLEINLEGGSGITKLDYDQKAQKVLFAAGGRTAEVVIKPDNTVAIGSNVCQGRDVSCITNELMLSLGGATPEEAAAIAVSAREELKGLKNGEYIANVIAEVAARLQQHPKNADFLPLETLAGKSPEEVKRFEDNRNLIKPEPIKLPVQGAQP